MTEKYVVPPVVRQAVEAAFEGRPGWRQLVAAAVREVGAERDQQGAAELLQRAVDVSLTWARENTDLAGPAAEHVVGLCGLIQGALLSLPARPAGLFKVRKSGPLVDFEPLLSAFDLPTGEYTLFAVPAQEVPNNG